MLCGWWNDEGGGKHGQGLPGRPQLPAGRGVAQQDAAGDAQEAGRQNAGRPGPDVGRLHHVLSSSGRDSDLINLTLTNNDVAEPSLVPVCLFCKGKHTDKDYEVG